ncbi:MAG: PVC-type heme-binding CxxCH protein [Pirellulales bacterium]
MPQCRTATVTAMLAALSASMAAAQSSGPPTPVQAASPLQSPVSDQGPLSPEESLARTFTPTGFEIQLVASEPQVLDPVAFDWDAAGRLWVVEMADYPMGMDGKGKPGGRIRVLEDADHDGRFESSTVFADGLPFPNGCLTWRDGVIVTAAPEILFLVDTNGDGRADRREVLVRGLAQGNQQLRPNGLRWGLDNWVYVASGSPGSAYQTTLEAPRSGVKLAVGARDFRFRPDTGELEAESGPTQFGRNRDDWGHWFGTQNAKPLWHYVMPERYAARNPFLVAPALTQPLLPVNVAVHPALPPEKRYHSFQQAGHYTSACSGMIHRDPVLGDAGQMTAFVCEPFHNLVQRVQLHDEGATFAGEPVVDDGRDFLTSTDRWFRPVMIRTGPDGGLWVADMHRFMIEHPDWLPPHGRDELLPKYRLGDDRGRIYRVIRAGAPAGLIPDLRPLDGPGLVRLLASDNGFLRDKAHQMLLWRGDGGVVPAVREVARDAAKPLAAMHALCVLEGLGRLEVSDLVPALTADHAGLQENALRLAEPFLAEDEPTVRDAVVTCATSVDPKVRFQAALSLGACPSALAGAALARLLGEHADDRFLLAAVLTSAPLHVSVLAESVVRGGPAVLDRVLAPLVQVAVGRNDEAALAALLGAVAGPPADVATSARLGVVLSALAVGRTDLPTIGKGGMGERVTREAVRLHALLDETLAFAAGADNPPATRLAAAETASRSAAHREGAVAVLVSWLTAARPADEQQRAIRALAAAGTDDVPVAFAAFWPEASPAVRQPLLEAWLSRDAWCLDLLTRVRRGEMAAAAIDPTSRSRLSKHRNRDVSSLASSVLGAATGTRAELIERYRPALDHLGDAARGLVVYRRACAGCHRHDGEGRAIGPDARTFAAHAPEKLLANILDPNADVQPGYQAFICSLDSGEQLYGIITGETAASISIKDVNAVERTIPRSQIEGLRATNVSFMPEGLEATLAPTDIADLIAFLRAPGHEPPVGGPRMRENDK